MYGDVTGEGKGSARTPDVELSVMVHTGCIFLIYLLVFMTLSCSSTSDVDGLRGTKSAEVTDADIPLPQDQLRIRIAVIDHYYRTFGVASVKHNRLLVINDDLFGQPLARHFGRSSLPLRFNVDLEHRDGMYYEKGGVTYVRLGSFDLIEISPDSVKVAFSTYASPNGSNYYEFKLRRNAEGQWVVKEADLVASS